MTDELKVFDWQAVATAKHHINSHYVIRWRRNKLLTSHHFKYYMLTWFLCDELQLKTHFVFCALIIPSSTTTSTTHVFVFYQHKSIVQ